MGLPMFNIVVHSGPPPGAGFPFGPFGAGGIFVMDISTGPRGAGGPPVPSTGVRAPPPDLPLPPGLGLLLGSRLRASMPPGAARPATSTAAAPVASPAPQPRVAPPATLTPVAQSEAPRVRRKRRADDDADSHAGPMPWMNPRPPTPHPASDDPLPSPTASEVLCP